MTSTTTASASPDHRFSVVRLDLPLDAAIFDGIVSADPQMALSVQKVQGNEPALAQALATANAYHITSARDDLAPQWFANAKLLQACPRLLVVSTFGAGYDTVDADACTQAGVCVVNQSGSNARAVAEHALAMTLGLAKRISESDRRLRRGDRFTRVDAMGFELDGLTLGLVGIGHTGGHMARLGHAMGMRVLAHDPLLSTQQITDRGGESVSLADLLARSDVVSVHCPRDKSTLGMFNPQAFAAMKNGALFVSTARGGIHDEQALYEALVSGHLRGAGLDVWAIEPPDKQHPLLGLDNVIGTYHTAGVSPGARRQMATMAATQLVQMAKGARPERLINPEVWPAYVRRFKQILGREPLSQN